MFGYNISVRCNLKAKSSCTEFPDTSKYFTKDSGFIVNSLNHPDHNEMENELKLLTPEPDAATSNKDSFITNLMGEPNFP